MIMLAYSRAHAHLQTIVNHLAASTHDGNRKLQALFRRDPASYLSLRSDFMREMDVMVKLNHTNVVHIMGAVLDGVVLIGTYTAKPAMYAHGQTSHVCTQPNQPCMHTAKPAMARYYAFTGMVVHVCVLVFECLTLGEDLAVH
jgi:hypothetical protein